MFLQRPGMKTSQENLLFQQLQQPSSSLCDLQSPQAEPSRASATGRNRVRDPGSRRGSRSQKPLFKLFTLLLSDQFPYPSPTFQFQPNVFLADQTAKEDVPAEPKRRRRLPAALTDTLTRLEPMRLPMMQHPPGASPGKVMRSLSPPPGGPCTGERQR